MILFISDGRLGNQLFQYAFLNTIRKDKEFVLSLNMDVLVSSFTINNSKFINISGNKLVTFLSRKALPTIFKKLGNFKVISYFEEKRSADKHKVGYSYTKGLLPISYVQTGFFQSEIFFDAELLGFKQMNDSLSIADKVISELPDTEKVFVHVRRGDYLNEAFEGEIDISLPKSYYLKAIDVIEKQISNPFYIFLTDDYDFVNEAYRDINNKYISTESMLVDLAIMSKCRYGVVSNSSFSWWGAYLSENKKVMIFPKYWYGWKNKIESHPYIQPSWGIVVDPNQKAGA